MCLIGFFFDEVITVVEELILQLEGSSFTYPPLHDRDQQVDV